jgi:hypothetical protein
MSAGALRWVFRAAMPLPNRFKCCRLASWSVRFRDLGEPWLSWMIFFVVFLSLSSWMQGQFFKIPADDDCFLLISFEFGEFGLSSHIPTIPCKVTYTAVAGRLNKLRPVRCLIPGTHIFMSPPWPLSTFARYDFILVFYTQETAESCFNSLTWNWFGQLSEASRVTMPRLLLHAVTTV